MRVALDASYSVDPQPSGIAVYSRELLSGLALAHPADQFLHCYRPKQFRHSPKPAYQNVRKHLLSTLWPISRADVFHALNQRVDRRAANRVVTTFHDLFVLTAEYSSPDFRKRFARQARRAVEQSDLIIAVSEFTANQVVDLLGVERGRVRVVPHGVHLPRNAPNAKREKIVLFVGALQTRKNIGRLIKAFESMPEPWRLVLAGAPTGFGADKILQQLDTSLARERIQVTGYLSRPALDDFFARASVFAFPSLDEGFGMPVLEAMSWGVPVLSSNSSALPEVAGGAALLVDPFDTSEIASGLRRLAQDEPLRNQLISAGHARCSQFSWSSSVNKTYTAYRELLR